MLPYVEAVFKENLMQLHSVEIPLLKVFRPGQLRVNGGDLLCKY